MPQLRLPPTTTRHDYVPFGGGLDQLTPILQLKPGSVRDSLNWEQSISGGYTRINGYERFDGRTAPSSANYFTLTLDPQLTTIEVNDTITGNGSGATGVVLSLDKNASGQTVLAYTAQTGQFIDGESLNVGGTLVGFDLTSGGNGTAADYDVSQRALAANVLRSLIQAVPGNGPIRGGFYYQGTVYAFRDNVNATALAMWKSSTSGWVSVPFGFEVRYTAGGTSTYTAGSTLTQGSVSATILAVSLESGSWASSTAAGHFIIATPVGGSGNFASGASTGGGTATLSGVQTPIVMLPGGHIQTYLGNFDGVVKVFGCDGVNRGWRFDGVTLAPINTGNAIDIPTNVLVHKDHLWFSFGTNLQNSGITTPFNWTAIAGSVAYRLDANITSLQRQPGSQAGGAMSVSTETGTEMIYGSSAADFQKVPFEQSAGARQYGGQRLGGQTLVFGNIGVFNLSATQAFGNFTPASMTMKIRTFTQTRRNQCTGSLVNREKSQYRVFFSDGYGLYMTILNGKLVGSMPVFFPNRVSACWQGDSPDGIEGSYFGSDNGFVYRLDGGTSHDGVSLDSFLVLPFANQGSVRMAKRYRRTTIEVQGDSYATFGLSYEINYGSGDRPQGSEQTSAALNLSAGQWDVGNWDTAMTWDGRTLTPSTLELRGTGENVALRVDCNSDKYDSFTLNSAIIDYSVRRIQRTNS